MPNFNTGLLCASILMLLVSAGNGENLKCYKCEDPSPPAPTTTTTPKPSIAKAAENAAASTTPKACSDASALDKTKPEESTEVNPETNKKPGCFVWNYEYETGKWRYGRGGKSIETGDNGTKACDELLKDVPTTAKKNCEFCFEAYCNTKKFPDSTTTTGSSVTIRANSFIYCIVIFAWFIRKFLSSDLLAK